LPSAFPDTATLHALLELAARAPSAQNSQPWHWLVDSAGLHLDADWGRRLGDTRADRTDVLLGCGAVLDHCAVALAAAGWQARIRRFPDGAAGHLAPAEATTELAEAIPRRRADRRPYGLSRLPAATLELLLIRAARFGVTMGVVPKVRWIRLVNGDIRLRYGPRDLTTEAEPDTGDGVLLVLATDSDDEDRRLLAGEAMSHLLLSATALGLSSCPVTEPLRDERDRLALACEVYDGEAYPQVLVRLGPSPDGATDLVPEPRRSVADTTTWR
jgi:hypothetical protein